MSKVSSRATLRWHKYRYFPYERDFARREIDGLLNPVSVVETTAGFEIRGPFKPAETGRLAYFSSVEMDRTSVLTQQANLERGSLELLHNGRNKQATRYSVHGLHEYKGKFNPQVVRGLLNILGIRKGRILDPFCGSGTTLIECAHLGIDAQGTDLNPLAAYLAKAKLQALTVPAREIAARGKKLLALFPRLKKKILPHDARRAYLQRWFDEDYLAEIEALRRAIKMVGGRAENIFLALASDLLRDYSLQEPMDLRVRRRKSPYPSEDLISAYKKKLSDLIINLQLTQREIGVLPRIPHVVCGDVRSILESNVQGDKFDGAITSPPYATALPYIDTQRLSLIWLDLCSPSELRRLEAALIGSRELVGRAKHNTSFSNNAENLPSNIFEYCQSLERAIGPRDGFRRKAVPVLLYRYFVDMRKMFLSVGAAMRPRAPFALIVGGNHTVLNGTKCVIDTPSLLADLAQTCGWSLRELVPLQTYQRFGLHSTNAVATESLILLEKQ